MSHVCARCHGFTVRERFEDFHVGAKPIEGWKCVNCGACGDQPDASWKQEGVKPFTLQVAYAGSA